MIGYGPQEIHLLLAASSTLLEWAARTTVNMNAKVVFVGRHMTTMIPQMIHLARWTLPGWILLALCGTGWAVEKAKPAPVSPDWPSVFSYRAEDLETLRAGFREPPRAAAPWVYWFWFENVVSREEITREMEEMAAAGIGGLELRSVSMHGFAGGRPGTWFDPQGWERLRQQRYEYLSPDHVGILEHTLSEAERLGLCFSMNLGMGWPPGGRWITDEHRSKHLVTDSRIVQGPMRLSGDEALEIPPNSTVLAWRLAAAADILDDRQIEATDRRWLVVPASFIPLNQAVGPQGTLQWNVPAGRWLIGIFTLVPGGLCDKGEGPEVDPASRDAVLFHLNEMFGRIEPKLGRFFGSTFVDVASDSWEYARSQQGRYWSPKLIESAPDILGYDLQTRMYVLLGYGPQQSETHHDLEQLQQQLIQKNYLETIGEFLGKRGLRHRPQLYGRGLERDLLAAYAIADVPEVEEGVYVPEAVWAARILSKPITSCEAFTHVSIRHGNLKYDAHRGAFSAATDPAKMWKTTPALLRALSNAHFARGINRIQMHSFSYSPPGIPAPGWRMYAEIHLNRNTPWWPELKPLCTWITRNQFVLQSGFPVADALVYPVKSNPVDGPFNVSGDQPWTAINAVDGANPYVLAELAKCDSKTPYQCRRIIVRDEIATLAEARHLLTLVDRGMTLWCCHTMPDQWQAMEDSDRDEVKRLQDRLQRAKDQGRVRDACHQSWQDVVASHQSVQWEGTGKISFQHRRVQGAEVYLVSSWEEPFRGQMSFPHADLVPEVWSAETGQVRPVEDRMVRGGRLWIAADLEKNDSRIVVFERADANSM